MLAFTAFLTYLMIDGSLSSHVDAHCNDCTAEQLRTKLITHNERTHQVLSWNVKDITNVGIICQYLKKLDLEVINLQEVSYDKYKELTETCLHGYKASGVPTKTAKTASARATLFNPIFLRNDLTLLKEIGSGQNTETGICSNLTWSRVLLQVTPGAPKKRHTKRTLSYNLFAILSGKKTARKMRMHIPRTHYSKKVLFANVHISGDNPKERSVIYDCLRHLYSTVNDRRRYRTILSGNFGSQQNTDFVTRFPRRRPLLEFCAPGKANPSSNICFSYHAYQNYYNYVMTATLATDTQSKPSFSAFTI